MLPIRWERRGKFGNCKSYLAHIHFPVCMHMYLQISHSMWHFMLRTCEGQVIALGANESLTEGANLKELGEDVYFFSEHLQRKFVL